MSYEAIKDEIVYTAYVNLYTLSKNNKAIYLNEFDPTNPSHRALYAIATMVSSNQNFKLYVGCGIFTYMQYKHEYGKLAYARRKTLKLGLTCDEMIKHIENAYERPGVFVEIYNEYYKFERKK